MQSLSDFEQSCSYILFMATTTTTTTTSTIHQLLSITISTRLHFIFESF